MKKIFAISFLFASALPHSARAATTLSLSDLTKANLNALEGLLGALVRNNSDLAICNKVGQFSQEVRTTMNLTTKNMEAQLAKAKSTLGEHVVPPKPVNDRDALVNALFELSLSADKPCLTATKSESVKRAEIKSTLIKMYRGYIALMRLHNSAEIPAVVAGLDIVDGTILSPEEKRLIKTPVVNISELIQDHGYKLGVTRSSPEGAPEVEKQTGHKI